MKDQNKEADQLKKNSQDWDRVYQLHNSQDWFNAYQEIDSFLADELAKVGKSFPIISDSKQEVNTIAAIKLLVKSK